MTKVLREPVLIIIIFVFIPVDLRDIPIFSDKLCTCSDSQQYVEKTNDRTLTNIVHCIFR